MTKTYISVTFTDDSEIQQLNKEYLDRDIPTDVLSFNVNEKMEDGTNYLGDIVVNEQQAERQAEEYGNTKEEELAELVGHGVLHLLGVHHPHDDEEEVHGVKIKQ